MATIKSFTDISQSKKLAEILPIESADMYFEKGIGDNYKEAFGNYADMLITENILGIKTIPCWSLSALLGVIKDKCGYYRLVYLKSTFDRCGNRLENVHRLSVDKYNDNVYKDELIDVCYEMIIRLHELNLL